MSQSIDIINHPSDVLGIAGFFLDNTKLGMIAHITGLQDQSVQYFTDTCILKSPVFITCKLPAGIKEYGYYLVTLYEVGTMQKLNDENVLTILILPVPTYVTVWNIRAGLSGIHDTLCSKVRPQVQLGLPRHL
jgi:hypothetical protein